MNQSGSGSEFGCNHVFLPGSDIFQVRDQVSVYVVCYLHARFEKLAGTQTKSEVHGKLQIQSCMGPHNISHISD